MIKKLLVRKCQKEKLKNNLFSYILQRKKINLR